MATIRSLVERFYLEVWNARAEDVADDILSPNFAFRGSLGPEKLGVDGFLNYTRDVHRALGRYECIIEDMVESGDRLAARMLFRGIHQADFFGVPAKGREIAWAGAAFFTAKDARLSSLWVLGDVDAVKAQLQD